MLIGFLYWILHTLTQIEVPVVVSIFHQYEKTTTTIKNADIIIIISFNVYVFTALFCVESSYVISVCTLVVQSVSQCRRFFVCLSFIYFICKPFSYVCSVKKISAVIWCCFVTFFEWQAHQVIVSTCSGLWVFSINRNLKLKIHFVPDLAIFTHFFSAKPFLYWPLFNSMISRNSTQIFLLTYYRYLTKIVFRF